MKEERKKKEEEEEGLCFSNFNKKNKTLSNFAFFLFLVLNGFLNEGIYEGVDFGTFSCFSEGGVFF